MHGNGFLIKKKWKDFPIKSKHFENGKSSRCWLGVCSNIKNGLIKNSIKGKGW
jgi:hypothetical protein